MAGAAWAVPPGGTVGLLMRLYAKVIDDMMQRVMQGVLADIVAATGLLSRLPIPHGALRHGGSAAGFAWAFPVAGALIGTVAALTDVLAAQVGLPHGMRAALVLVVLVSVTGAIHEDGLADSTDGLWGGADRARRLEIMKDSRIGTYGVLALILSLLIRWLALSALLQAGSPWFLIGVAALSRAPMVALMGWMPTARPDGLSASVGQPGARTVWLALCAGGVIALATLAPFGIAGAAFAALSVALVSLALARLAISRIGGQTGDILGACQQLAESAALLSLTAFAMAETSAYSVTP